MSDAPIPARPWRALAADYDGTLARGGTVPEPVLTALARVRAAGARLVLVTGRRLDDLARVFPALDRVDVVVAENGALLYDPTTRAERVLAAPPPSSLLAALEARRVPFARGRVIVATDETAEARLRAAIEALRLDLRIIRNKGAVMVLPAGVDKGTGARAALEGLGVAPADTIAVGDGENDEALLRACGLRVAVADAVPELRAIAQRVTRESGPAGVVELVASWLAAS